MGSAACNWRPNCWRPTNCHHRRTTNIISSSARSKAKLICIVSLGLIIWLIVGLSLADFTIIMTDGELIQQPNSPKWPSESIDTLANFTSRHHQVMTVPSSRSQNHLEHQSFQHHHFHQDHHLYEAPKSKSSYQHQLKQSLKLPTATLSPHSVNTSNRSGFHFERLRRDVREKKPILNEFSFPSSLVQGMRFVLMCTILDGDGPINIRWFRDSQELSNKNPLDIEVGSAGELGSTLVFRRVHQSQTGNYTCLASNQAGQASFTSFMSVKVPPRWKLEPTDQFAIIGDTVIIDCQAEGNPTPFIRWKQSTVQLSNDHITHHHLSKQFRHPNGLLGANRERISTSAISSAISESSGSSISASAGSGNSDLMMIGGASGAGTDNQSNMIDSNNMMIDQEATISGQEATDLEQQRRKIGQNFKLINSNHYMQSLENGSLSIRMISKDNEGYYMCEADNGVEPNINKVVKLVVHHQASFKSGHMFKLIKLLHNDPIKLDCQPSGDQPLTVQWFKDGQPISLPLDGSQRHLGSGHDQASSHQRFHFDTRESEEGLHSDAIGPSAQRSDSGLYSCLARNQFGSSERKLRVIVMEPPDKPKQVDIVQVSSRSISLRWISPFDGNSPILRYQFEYKRDHEPWSAALAIEFVASPSNAKLYLAASSTGAGIGVGVESPSGVDTSNGNALIIDHSPATAANSQHSGHLPTGNDNTQLNHHHQQQQESSLLLVSGTVSGSTSAIDNIDSSSPSSSNVISSTLPNGIRATKQLVSSNGVMSNRQTVQHSIQNLQPLARYSIRVSAINSIGKGPASIPVTIRTEEEVPSIQPRQVRAQVLSSRSVKLSWSITFMPTQDLIEGFFLGYRSKSGQAGGASNQANHEAPTYTYKTIKLMNNNINQQPIQQQNENNNSNNNNNNNNNNNSQMNSENMNKLSLINGSIQYRHQQQNPSSFNPATNSQNLVQPMDKTASVYLSPVSSSATTLVAPSSNPTGASPAIIPDNGSSMGGSLVAGAPPMVQDHDQRQANQIEGSNDPTHSSSMSSSNVMLTNTFEYIILNLERNTDYTILIQCYNRKGAGPSSDPVLLRTFVNDPPDKLALTIDEVTESSAKLSWHFIPSNQEHPRPTAPSLVTSSGGMPLTTTMGIYHNHNQGAIENGPGGISLNSSSLSSALSQTTSTTGSGSGSSQIPLQQTSLVNNSSITLNGGGSGGGSLIMPANRQMANAPGDNTGVILDNLNDGQSSTTSTTNTASQWQSIQLPVQQRSYQLKNLDCGSSYVIWIMAFNKVGKGEPSDLLTINTRGKAPVAPDKRSFLSINVTHVRLHLSAWYDGGCEIDHFMIQYKPRLQDEWVTLSDNILREQVSVVIRDLLPGTWHDLLVTAKNQVGSTEIKYRFATLNLDGSQVSPLPEDMMGAQQSGDGFSQETDGSSALGRGDGTRSTRGRLAGPFELLWPWHWSWSQFVHDPLVFVPVICTILVLALISCIAILLLIVRWRQKAGGGLMHLHHANISHHHHHNHSGPGMGDGASGSGGGGGGGVISSMVCQQPHSPAHTTNQTSNHSSPGGAADGQNNHQHQLHHYTDTLGVGANSNSNNQHHYHNLANLNDTSGHLGNFVLPPNQQNAQQNTADSYRVLKQHQQHNPSDIMSIHNPQVIVSPLHHGDGLTETTRQLPNEETDDYCGQSQPQQHNIDIYSQAQATGNNNQDSVDPTSYLHRGTHFGITGGHQQGKQMGNHQSPFSALTSSLSICDRMTQRLIMNGYATLSSSSNNNNSNNNRFTQQRHTKLINGNNINTNLNGTLDHHHHYHQQRPNLHQQLLLNKGSNGVNGGQNNSTTSNDIISLNAYSMTNPALNGQHQQGIGPIKYASSSAGSSATTAASSGSSGITTRTSTSGVASDISQGAFNQHQQNQNQSHQHLFTNGGIGDVDGSTSANEYHQDNDAQSTIYNFMSSQQNVTNSNELADQSIPFVQAVPPPSIVSEMEDILMQQGNGCSGNGPYQVRSNPEENGVVSGGTNNNNNHQQQQQQQQQTISANHFLFEAAFDSSKLEKNCASANISNNFKQQKITGSSADENIIVLIKSPSGQQHAGAHLLDSGGMSWLTGDNVTNSSRVNKQPEANVDSQDNDRDHIYDVPYKFQQQSKQQSQQIAAHLGDNNNNNNKQNKQFAF